MTGPSKREARFVGPVIDLVRELFAADDETLDAARQRAADAGLPAIEVAPEDGALLGMLIRLGGFTRVAEIGTLFGYSGIWMARALPAGGHLWTVEVEPRHAAVAAANFAAAGVADKVTLVEGAAQDALAAVPTPVDMVFVDADKAGYPAYLAWARQALRPGGLVAADNAFQGGRVAEPGEDRRAIAVRGFLERLAADPAWESVMVPTLEGMVLGRRTSFEAAGNPAGRPVV